MLVRRDVLLQHFDAYMDHLYWIPSHGFLHPANTYREIQDGTLDPMIAAGICAISSCFVNPGESGREFAAKCSALVDMHLYNSIYMFSDELLVIFALNITAQLLRGEFAKVWQSFGVASRLMLGLRVNWDVPSGHKSFVQQETIRRTVWQYFHIDRMLAGGYDEYLACRADIMKISLPCAETNFLEDRPVAAEKLDDKPGSKPGTVNMHAYQLRLMDLRHRIQAFVKRLSNAPKQPVDASKLMADINALQNELTRFHMCLPPDLLLTDQSVAKFMRRPERVGFVWLHAHLHVSHIDLYRFTLPRQRDKASADILRRLPRDFLAKAQKQAVTHAMAMARFYDAIQIELDKLPKTNKLVLAGDYSAFQMSTHCVRVLLLALQFGLYKDLTDVPTSALWQKIKPDEAYLRYLIDAVQRVNEPWCAMMDVARQAVCVSCHNYSCSPESDWLT